jgi:DNA-binding NarL/FixJ family response regulator
MSENDDVKAFDEFPGPPLVLLADQLSREQLLRFLGARVLGILPRSAAGAQICAALEAAATGLITLTPGDWEFALSPTALPEEDDDLLEALTPREAQVLALMARGLGNKEIAESLKISEHTAKFHVGSVLSKLAASSRTEAVTKALKQGLLIV